MKPKPVTLEYIRTPRLWDADRAPIGIPDALWRESVERDEREQDRRWRERNLPHTTEPL